MNKRILAVDDDESIRRSLEKVLTEAGYSTVLACDGREGLGCLSADKFDLILLDLDLPTISGWDVLDHMRENQPLIPVIILTAFAQDCEPGAAVGADLIMEKPPDVVVLLRNIEKLLSEPPEQRVRRMEIRHRFGSPGFLLPCAAPAVEIDAVAGDEVSGPPLSN